MTSPVKQGLSGECLSTLIAFTNITRYVITSKFILEEGGSAATRMPEIASYLNMLARVCCVNIVSYFVQTVLPKMESGSCD